MQSIIYANNLMLWCVCIVSEVNCYRWWNRDVNKEWRMIHRSIREAEVIRLFKVLDAVSAKQHK